jgi:hypothetical protein
MADYNSSLPIRTESAGDAIVKVADAITPSQQLKVESDGSINVNGSFSLPSGSEIKITDGTDDLAVNADGSLNITDNGGSLTVDASNLDIRDLVFATDKVDVSGSSVTVSATDLDIRDLSHSQDSVKVGDGTDFLAVNSDGSINVKLSDRSGTEIDSYNTSAALAAAASSNHDYTTTGTFRLTSVEASASGKMKIEIQIETAAASGVFNTKCVMFNSTANPNMSFQLKSPILVASGAKVRVIRTNKDNQAQDVYSTILGYNE